MATKTGGRTQQGRTPAPMPQAPGQIRPPRQPVRRASGTTPAPAQPRPSSRPGRGPMSAGAARSRTGGRTQQASQPRASSPSPATRRAAKARSATTSRRPASPFTSRTRQAQRTGRQFTAPEFHNYQGIILAEFVLAELLVAATPIATNRQTPGLSPYVPRDMTKLLSIGLLYFLLELMAVGGRGAGRLGAWFGGLILLVVGLNEAANIAKDLDIFAGLADKAKQITGGGGGGRPTA